MNSLTIDMLELSPMIALSLKGKSHKHTKEIQIRTTVSVEPSGSRREGDIRPLHLSVRAPSFLAVVVDVVGTLSGPLLKGSGRSCSSSGTSSLSLHHGVFEPDAVSGSRAGACESRKR